MRGDTNPSTPPETPAATPEATTSRDGSARAKLGAAAKIGLLSGAALGMSAGEVMATIIDFGSVPMFLSWGANGTSSLTLDVDGGGTADLAIGGSAGGNNGRVYLLPPGMSVNVNVLTNGAGLVAALAPGASIGTQSSFVAIGMGGVPFLQVMYNMMNMTYSTQGSFAGGPQYFGFQFYYGTTLVNAWGLLSVSGSGLPTGLNLVGGAFESSGGPIAAGAGAALPEPGTGALVALGLGAAGVQSMRERRKRGAPSGADAGR